MEQQGTVNNRTFVLLNFRSIILAPTIFIFWLVPDWWFGIFLIVNRKEEWWWRFQMTFAGSVRVETTSWMFPKGVARNSQISHPFFLPIWVIILLGVFFCTWLLFSISFIFIYWDVIPTPLTKSHHFSRWLSHHHQWIGLREKLQESPIFNGKIYGFRLRFSLKPIHWHQAVALGDHIRPVVSRTGKRRRSARSAVKAWGWGVTGSWGLVFCQRWLVYKSNHMYDTHITSMGIPGS